MKISAPTKLPSKAELQAMEIAMAELDKIGRTQDDVHPHAKAVGGYFQAFYQVDTKYKLSTLEDFNAIAKEILDEAKNDSRTVKALNTIKNSQGAIETETNINVFELLMRAWNLAKKPGNFKNARELIIYNLNHNADAKGGCLAGISVRLVFPYAHFVSHLLNPDYHYKNANTRTREEDDLMKAVIASLEPTSPQITINNNQQNEDALFEEAIAASLKDFQPQPKEQDLLEQAIVASLEQDITSFQQPPQRTEEELLEAAIKASLTYTPLLQQEQPQDTVQELSDLEIAKILSKDAFSLEQQRQKRRQEREEQENLDRAIAEILTNDNNNDKNNNKGKKRK